MVKKDIDKHKSRTLIKYIKSAEEIRDNSLGFDSLTQTDNDLALENTANDLDMTAADMQDFRG